MMDKPMTEQEVKRMLRKEKWGVRSTIVHAHWEVGDHDHYPMLLAPVGGVTLLQLHFIPIQSTAKNPNAYWEFELEIYDKRGNERRTIALPHLDNEDQAFTDKVVLTYPITGRFDERLEEGEVVIIDGNVTGGAGTVHAVVQLDYLLGRA